MICPLLTFTDGSNKIGHQFRKQNVSIIKVSENVDNEKCSVKLIFSNEKTNKTNNF